MLICLTDPNLAFPISTSSVVRVVNGRVCERRRCSSIHSRSMYVSYDASMNFTNVRWLYDKTNYGERVVNTLSGLDQGCLRVNRNVFSFDECIPRSSIFAFAFWSSPQLYNCSFNQLCEWRMFSSFSLFLVWGGSLSSTPLCLPQSHLPV